MIKNMELNEFDYEVLEKVLKFLTDEVAGDLMREYKMVLRKLKRME